MLPGPQAHRRAGSQKSLQAPTPGVEHHHMSWSKPSAVVRVRSALAVVVCVIAFTACTPEQTASYDRINAIRTQNSLNTLLPSPYAMAKAQNWAERLAATGKLEHSDLWAGMPDGGLAIGENVGMGASLDSIYAAFMVSTKHRTNLLDPRWNWVGTGVATNATGTVFVVQVFANY